MLSGRGRSTGFPKGLAELRSAGQPSAAVAHGISWIIADCDIVATSGLKHGASPAVARNSHPGAGRRFGVRCPPGFVDRPFCPVAAGGHGPGPSALTAGRATIPRTSSVGRCAPPADMCPAPPVLPRHWFCISCSGRKACRPESGLASAKTQDTLRPTPGLKALIRLSLATRACSASLP